MLGAGGLWVQGGVLGKHFPDPSGLISLRRCVEVRRFVKLQARGDKQWLCHEGTGEVVQLDVAGGFWTLEFTMAGDDGVLQHPIKARSLSPTS